MKRENLKKRTNPPAWDLVRLVERPPAGKTCRVGGWQRLRTGASVGAHHRAANRVRSHANSVSNLGIAGEERDACADRLDLWVDDAKPPATAAAPWPRDADQRAGLALPPLNTARNRHDR